MEVSKSAAAPNATGQGLRLAVLRRWSREHPWLRGLYRLLPLALRERMSRRWVKQMIAATRFPELPPAPDGPPTLAAEPSPGEAGRRGANMFAYFRGEFGLAESARSYALALIDSGYPVALNDIRIDLPHGFGDRTLEAHLVDSAPYPINLIFVNPDYLHTALAEIGEAKLAGRYSIACWFWELEKVPAEWLAAIESVDEILVASTFIEQAFRAATSKPVTRVPLPVTQAPGCALTRAQFGLEENTFVFLTSFDFHSWVERKNPLATIEAFRLAFPDRSTPVRLLVKTSNGAHHPEMFSSLLELARSDPRILVREGILERSHLRSLQRCCDAYVSLHRSEGFGLGLAECMALGKPVIATAWSGNCDFMSPENSCLVSYRLVEVGPGEYLHGEGQRWASADVADAASYMQRVFDDPAFAARIGQRAAADVARLLCSANSATALIDRLDRIAAAIAVDGQPVRSGGA